MLEGGDNCNDEGRIFCLGGKLIDGTGFLRGEFRLTGDGEGEGVKQTFEETSLELIRCVSIVFSTRSSFSSAITAVVFISNSLFR